MSSPPSLPALSPSMSFDEAARAVVAHLRQVMPWGSWSVSRVTDGQQIHIVVDADGLELPEGTAVPLEQTICVRMLAGDGPRIAPRLEDVPAYANQAGAIDFGIGAYAGVPIHEQDGTTFGVLCGLSHDAEDADAAANQGLLELLAGLLGIVLAADRVREDAARALAAARLEASTDILTGLPNRRAWNEIILEEEARYAKFGDAAAVAIVDLDRLKNINDTQGHDAGDAYIQAAGTAMRQALDPRHVVARLGGDEFGILLRQTGVDDAQELVDSVYAHLDDAGVAGSIGWAPYTVVKGFPGALRAADEAMYDAKQCRRRQLV